MALGGAVTAPSGCAAVLRLSPHVAVAVEGAPWEIEEVEACAGHWLLFAPAGDSGGVDVAPAVARLLATLAAPLRGSVAILGQDPQRLSYPQVQELRRRVGLVQGWGGLLSNRSLRENVALPALVHGLPGGAEAGAAAAEMMARLGLGHLAEARPHQVDRLSAWRARVARALMLDPAWLVLEGIGDWTPGGSAAWSLLEHAVDRGAALAVCLSRPAPAFEQWLRGRGGRVVGCRPAAAEVTGGGEVRR